MTHEWDGGRAENLLAVFRAGPVGRKALLIARGGVRGRVTLRVTRPRRGTSLGKSVQVRTQNGPFGHDLQSPIGSADEHRCPSGGDHRSRVVRP